MSPPSMRSRAQLFTFQREKLIPRIVSGRQVAAFVRMGYGKTISTLTSLVDLGMPRSLVVAPARVAREVWHKEAASWEHTKDLRFNVLSGVSPAERDVRLARDSDIDVINYELFVWLCENIDLETRYGAIVFDELSRMKTPGAKWFKRMRTRTMEIPIRIGLTGTPVGNHYVDLWGEMFAVAGEKPLGPSKALYCAQYFTAIPVNEYGAKMWVINYGSADLINERVCPWSFSIGPEDAPPLPPVKVNPIYVPLPPAVRKHTDELARDLRTELASGKQLVAIMSGARASKVRQMAGGAVYLADGSWEKIHDEKMDALAEIIDEQQGRPLIVFYWFRHELERMQVRFPQARTLTASNIDEWNAGKIEVLLVHPASAGHGLNLQFGGSEIVWYSLPWWELFTQGNGRLARPGQREKTVMAHVLLAGEGDVAILQHLREQEEAEQKLIQYTRI